jgi:hypothetical protein
LWNEAYYRNWLRQNPLFQEHAKHLTETGGRDSSGIDARFIRNALISKIINEQGVELKVSETGARLEGTTILGMLDLTGLEFCRPIHFTSCTFEKEIVLEYAELGHVSLAESRVPTIKADMVDIGGDLDLENLRGCQSIRLRRARIRGTLQLQGAELVCTPGEQALNARGAEIGGSVWLRRYTPMSPKTTVRYFSTPGEINFTGATVGGRFDCTDAKLSNPGKHALSCGGTKIGAAVYLDGAVANGQVNFKSATIGGGFQCSSATFSQTQLPPASEPDENASERERHMHRALDCTGARIGGGVVLKGVVASGEVSFVDASVSGDFECQRSSFEGFGKHDALDLEEVDIRGTLYLTRVKSFKGRLDLQDAFARSLADDESAWKVPGTSGRRTRSRDGVTLELDRFRYDSFADDYRDGKTNPDWRTRRAWLMAQPRDWCGKEFRPQPFTHCAKVLFDMGYSRDARRILYCRERLKLRHKEMPFYEKFFGWTIGGLAGHGFRNARTLGIMFLFWLGGAAIFSVGYQAGWMRPASEVYLQHVDYNFRGALPKDYEPFKPLIYSADVIVPIISFGEHHYWAPRDGTEWPVPPKQNIWWWPKNQTISLPWYLTGLPKVYFWLETLIGWLLTTVVAARFTGLLDPGREE